MEGQVKYSVKMKAFYNAFASNSIIYDISFNTSSPLKLILKASKSQIPK